MHVFITGASGFIGTAAITELLSHGHTVTGLGRSDSSLSKISALGAQTLRGDVEDLATLSQGAAAADAVIHLAFNHEFADFAGCCATDRTAIQALADGIGGSGKTLAIASGTLMAVRTELADEDSELAHDNPPISDRALSADLLFKLAEEKGFRGVVVRLSPSVHGKGDKGMFPMMIDAAKKAGSVPTVNNGARWPAVHRQDVGTLFRLVLEKGTGKKTYNAVAEQGVPIYDVLSIISKRTNLPLEETTADQIFAKLGFAGMASTIDNATSSVKTQAELGWKPRGPTLIENVEAWYL